MQTNSKQSKDVYFKNPETARDSDYKSIAWWTEFGIILYQGEGSLPISREERDKFWQMIHGDLEMRKLAIILLLEIKKNGKEAG